MIRNCDTCYHRKTDRCPNSSECYEIENKPYYEPTLETIEKLTPNDLIEILNPELVKLNKQYEIEKQQLISFLEERIKIYEDNIENSKQYLEHKELFNQVQNDIHTSKCIITNLKEVLDFVNKGGKDE